MIVDLDLECPYCRRSIRFNTEPQFGRGATQFVFGTDDTDNSPCRHLLWMEASWHDWELLEDGSTRAGSEDSETYSAIDPDTVSDDYLRNLAMQSLEQTLEQNFEPKGDHSIQDFSFESDRELTQNEIRRMVDMMDSVGKKPSIDQFRVHNFAVSGQAVFAADPNAFAKECATQDKRQKEYFRIE